MRNNNLQYTKRRLTVLFTVAIFCIVFVLWVSFFSFRYFGELRQDNRKFKNTTTRILKKMAAREDILDFFNISEGQERFDDTFSQSQWPQEKLISYIVINKNNEIVEKSLKEEINFHVLFEKEYGNIYHEEWVFVRKEKIQWLFGETTVLLYKKARYPFSSFLIDIVQFSFLTFLFSSLFAYLSYRFVNRTLKPVQENLSDMQDFIHNAGHELKTPISIIRGNLQIMQAEKKFDSKLVKQWIKKIDNLNALIERLIELSGTGRNTQKQSLLLSQEIEVIVKEYKIFSQKYHVTIKNIITGDYKIYANKEELYVLLSNLLKNAIRYNKKWWEVIFSLHKNILSIKDTGEWISQKDQEKIFDRFYQGEKARSGNGFGIGLSLVKKIAEGNDWTIEVKSVLWKGTEFKITL